MYRDFCSDIDFALDAGCLYQRQARQYSNPARSKLEHVSNLDIDVEPAFVRMTNMVCTIGESCSDNESLRKLIMNGMNIARLNLTLGTYQYHSDIIRRLRQVEKTTALRHTVGIAVDITSPTVRTGFIENNPDAEVKIAEGSFVTLTTNDEFKDKCSQDIIWIDKVYFPDVIVAMNIGDRIYVDDGALIFIVREKLIDSVKCLVEQGGSLGSSKRCQIPRHNVYKHAVASKYRQNLLFAIENEVDFLFASFIESGEDIRRIKQVIGSFSSSMRIMAKIETKQAAKIQVDDILDAADGLIISRGDLGLELPPEKVFIVQKNLVAKCMVLQKPVFITGQMLESMRYKPRPTRAEVSDIANAVLDGADGLILTVETARGSYPIECTRIMHQICREAESALFHEKIFLELKRCRPLDQQISIAHGTAMSAVAASMKSYASAIIVVTTTGRAAQLLASYRPICPILTVTRKASVARLCHLYRGLHALLYEGDKEDDWSTDIDMRINFAIAMGRKRGFFKENDTVVIVNGWVDGPEATNTVRTFKIPGESEELHVVRSIPKELNQGYGSDE